jgi:hypothetical protein
MVCEKNATIAFWKLCPTEEDLGILMLSAVIGQEGENRDNRDWVRLKVKQLTLSMGPAGVEVCNYVQRATIPSQRIISYSEYSQI